MKGGTSKKCFGIKNYANNCWLSAQLQTMLAIEESFDVIAKIHKLDEYSDISEDQLKAYNNFCPNRTKNDISFGTSDDFVHEIISHISEKYGKHIIGTIIRSDKTNLEKIMIQTPLGDNNKIGEITEIKSIFYTIKSKYILLCNHYFQNHNKFIDHIKEFYNTFTPIAVNVSTEIINGDESHQYAIRHCDGKYTEIDDETITDLTKLQMHNLLNGERCPELFRKLYINYVIFKNEDTNNIDYNLTESTEVNIEDFKLDKELIYIENNDTSIDNKIFLNENNATLKLDFSKMKKLTALNNVTINNVPNIYLRNPSLNTINNLTITNCEKLFINNNNFDSDYKLDLSNIHAECIDLSNNTIGSVIIAEDKCELLNLSYNKIEYFDITGYNYLTVLNLSNNNIRSLPSIIKSDILLEISFKNNKILSINNVLFDCPKLYYLSLENNFLTDNVNFVASNTTKIDIVDISVNTSITTFNCNFKIKEIFYRKFSIEHLDELMSYYYDINPNNTKKIEPENLKITIENLAEKESYDTHAPNPATIDCPPV